MKKFLTFCLKLSLAFLICFGTLEIALRIHNPMPFAVRRGRVILPANKTYTFKNTRSKKLDPVIVFKKNSLGLRGAEPPANYKDVLTIIAVGGSTTECASLTDGKTWPDLLGDELRKTFPDVWINNAGISGHSTFGHLLLMEDHILRLKPKVILFYPGINDVENNALGKYDTNSLKGYVDTYSMQAFMQSLARNSEVLSLISNLAQLTIAKRRGLNLSDIDLTHREQVPMTDEDIAKLVEMNRKDYLPGYRDRIRRLNALCRENHILAIFMTQPALYGPVTDDVTGADLGTMLADGMNHRNGRAAWTILEMYNDVMRDLQKSGEINLVEIGRVMPKSSRLFHDCTHYTNEGAQVVCGIIAPEIKRIIEEKLPGAKAEVHQ